MCGSVPSMCVCLLARFAVHLVPWINFPTVVGCMNGLRVGAHPLVCVICGVMTATFGGMIRDIICRCALYLQHLDLLIIY